MSINWKAAQNYEELSKLAADIFEQQLQENEKSVLGLATGGTPEGLYSELVQRYNDGKISFEKATSFNLDEYVGLSADHPASYHYFMDTHLFHKVNMRRDSIHLPSGDAEDLQAIAEAYDKKIEASGGIDLQLLGIGVNGHIGFNEPGSSFEASTNIIKLTDSTREQNKIYFDSIVDVPSYAITMGIKTIMQAKKIVLLIAGSDKQGAIDHLSSGIITEDFPASILHKHTDVTIIYTGVEKKN